MSNETIILERLAALTDRVEAMRDGQEALRRAIESGADGLQVRVRLLEDRVAQDREERDRMIEAQASFRAQLIATIVGVALTALGGIISTLL